VNKWKEKCKLKVIKSMRKMSGKQKVKKKEPRSKKTSMMFRCKKKKFGWKFIVIIESHFNLPSYKIFAQLSWAFIIKVNE
jgi:hypothetical protein